MTARKTWLFGLAICAAIAFQSQIAVAQIRFVNFTVDQLPQPGGGITYRLLAAQTRASGISSSGTFLTSPNGLIFPSVPSLDAMKDFNSFAELGSALFGDWLATENPTSGPDNTYNIRVAPFTLADVFSESAVISSPMPGSTVGLDFVVKWGFPSGATPSSSAISFNYGPPLDDVAPVQHGVDGMYSAGFHTQLSGPGPADIRILTGVTVRPDPQVLNRSPGVVGQLISTNSWFNAYSLEATYHVIPEPSSVSALILGLACLIHTPRRR
jgi:hypothetical protein